MHEHNDVMPVLDTGIHALIAARIMRFRGAYRLFRHVCQSTVDARVKPGHDTLSDVLTINRLNRPEVGLTRLSTVSWFRNA